MSLGIEDAGTCPLTCIASADFCSDTPHGQASRIWKPSRGHHISRAQFTPDGSTIITQHDDHRLGTFVLPENLLDETKHPHELTTHTIYKSGTEIQDFAIFPGFDLRDLSTTYILCGDNDQPISLRNACDWTHLQAKYPLVNERTEAHFPPRALHFINNGAHFLVGSHNHLAVFDITRYNEGPISLTQLKPRKGTYDGMSLSRKAHVSALATSSVDNLLALGTTEREVALYEHAGQGACTAVFNLDRYPGSGVSTLHWSPCGKYLIIAERRSDEVQVYDIRDTRRQVSKLIERMGNTNQRLGADVVQTTADRDGYEYWAGGVDGVVRMWSDPGAKEGECPPTEELALHDAPVTSAMLHPFTPLLATSSGSRPSLDEDDQEPGKKADSALRVYTLPAKFEETFSCPSVVE